MVCLRHIARDSFTVTSLHHPPRDTQLILLIHGTILCIPFYGYRASADRGSVMLEDPIGVAVLTLMVAGLVGLSVLVR
jgi:hypothetical protein